MEKVFADTGYWIALLNPHDDLHQAASAATSSLGTEQIVTSEMVLAEFLNSFSEWESIYGWRRQERSNLSAGPQTSLSFRKQLSSSEGPFNDMRTWATRVGA